MSLQKTNSTVSPKTAPLKKRNTNWHEAAVCAVQIDLQEYAHLLQFLSEYTLGRNNYRIDLLIIKKLSEEIIPKNIAHIFKSYNLFEIKGIGSCISTDSYYKAIGYAGLLINQAGKRNQYTALDVSLSFLSFHYPRKLMKHLQKDRKLTVEKFSDGVYHIINETFIIQIIVTKELPPKENLYLHCLTDDLNNAELIKLLIDDYQCHQEQDIYIRYMNQLTNANSNKEGRSPMFEEMMERARAEVKNYYQYYYQDYYQGYYQDKIEQLSSKIDHLEDLLKQHNIQFD